ncbi:MAG: bifunctional nuclease family protein [Firmicutes bacterium]|nr:bifunctional nuclease family protein [Bacillota bacterium]
MEEMVRVKVKLVGIDQVAMCPVVVITDMDEKNFLPIMVGPAEASAIAMELEGIKPPRPLTHDLMRDLLSKLDAQVDQVVISDLRDETYYGSIVLKTVAGTVEIDARPSDAIALALRTESPIFISETVANQAMIAGGESDERETPVGSDDREAEEFRRFLDNLTPEDFRRHLQ